jgi:hypothetical protein
MRPPPPASARLLKLTQPLVTIVADLRAVEDDQRLAGVDLNLGLRVDS